MPHKQQSFNKLFLQPVKSGKLKKHLVMTLGVIASLSEQRGYCYATNEHLAKELGIAPRGVQKQLAELKNAGCITSEMSTGNRTRHIFLTPEYKEMYENKPKIKKREKQKESKGIVMGLRQDNAELEFKVRSLKSEHKNEIAELKEQHKKELAKLKDENARLKTKLIMNATRKLVI